MMFAMPIICESSYIESSACTHGCKASALRRIGLSIEELGIVEFVNGGNLVNVLHGRFTVSLNTRAFQGMASRALHPVILQLRISDIISIRV